MDFKAGDWLIEFAKVLCALWGSLPAQEKHDNKQRAMLHSVRSLPRETVEGTLRTYLETTRALRLVPQLITVPNLKMEDVDDSVLRSYLIAFSALALLIDTNSSSDTTIDKARGSLEGASDEGLDRDKVVTVEGKALLENVDWRIFHSPEKARIIEGDERKELDLSEILFDRKVTLTVYDRYGDRTANIRLKGRTVRHVLKAIYSFYSSRAPKDVDLEDQPWEMGDMVFFDGIQEAEPSRWEVLLSS